MTEQETTPPTSFSTRSAEWFKDWWDSDEFSWADLRRTLLVGWSVVDEQLVPTRALSSDTPTPATLQDYYRWDQASNKLRSDEEMVQAGLISPQEGEFPIFHIFQLPKTRKDGTATWKSNLEHDNWGLLERVMAELMQRAGPTEVDNFGNATAIDCRCQLHGGTYRSFPKIEPDPQRHSFSKPSETDRVRPENASTASRRKAVYISAFAAHFLSNVKIEHFNFECTTDFQNSLFDKNLLVDDCRFSQIAQFWNVTVGGLLVFSNTECFSEFVLARSFITKASIFKNCAFRDRIDISDANFGSHISINHCVTNGSLLHSNVKFENALSIIKSHIYSNLNFSNSEIKCPIAIKDTTFYNTVHISECHINADFVCNDSVFESLINCNRSRFTKNVKFISSTFRNVFAITSSLFDQDGSKAQNRKTNNNECLFSGVRFLEDCFFRNTIFRHAVKFVAAEFHGMARFGVLDGTDTRDKLPAAQFENKVSFRLSRFFNHADFVECSFPSEVGDRSGGFDGVNFKEQANFRRVNPLPVDMFNGANIQSIMLNADEPTHAQFAQALKAVGLAARADRAVKRSKPALPWLRRLLPWVGPATEPRDPYELDRGNNKRFGALEGGCHALKRAMSNTGDFRREQQFYRYELIARQRRPTNWSLSKSKTTISPFDKFLAWLYSGAADYGNAVGRPFALAIGLVPGFGFFFWVWARQSFGLPVDLSSLWDAAGDGQLSASLEFALQNALFPLGVSDSGFVIAPGSWLDAFRRESGPAGWNLIRATSSLQSITTIALLFLAALGIRRKFQIS